MKYSSLAALAAALIGLSGCIAYPVDNYSNRGDRGAERDRGRDHDRDRRDNRGDSRDDDRDRGCDPRVSDCRRP